MYQDQPFGIFEAMWLLSCDSSVDAVSIVNLKTASFLYNGNTKKESFYNHQLLTRWVKHF